MLSLRGQPSGTDHPAVRLWLWLLAQDLQAKRYEDLVKEAHNRWEASGLPSREIEHLADRVTGFRTERLPIDQSGQSQTMDTKVACKKLLGNITDPALGGLSFWTQPNSWHHFMSDHIVTFSVIPVSPT
ncbi:MAG: anthranilate 1,2-dioxygenase large subunit, partial [Pseudomonadota bacterium]